MAKNDSQLGFTLIEVMIVIAIIGILSAIAIPSYLTMLPNMRLKAAARDLFSNIQRARIGAIKTNTELAIDFDPANNTYTIYSDSGDGDWSTLSDNTIMQVLDFTQAKYGIGYGDGDIGGLNAATENSTAIPENGVSYTNNRLVLNSKGAGSAGYIYLQNQNNRVYAIGTTTSGTIRLKQWMGGSWK